MSARDDVLELVGQLKASAEEMFDTGLDGEIRAYLLGLYDELDECVTREDWDAVVVLVRAMRRASNNALSTIHN